MAKLAEFRRILMDFQSNDEPLWTYFDNQNNYIINHSTSEYDNAVKGVEGANKRFPFLLMR